MASSFSDRIARNAARSRLFPYQRRGALWMLNRETTVDDYGITGGILCDEMGLGKTRQMLAVIHANPQPTLIVVPVSVLGQWRDECVARTGIVPLMVAVSNLRRTIYSTGADGMITAVPNPRFIDKMAVMQHSVVIAPHSCFNNANIEFTDHPLLDAVFGRVIVDEAHVLKNTKSLMAQYMSDVRARSRWCLTGTPVVSSINDMRSLLSFLLESNTEKADQIIQDSLDSLDAEERNGTDSGTRVMDIVMRRTNADVAGESERMAPVPARLSLEMLEFSRRERAKYAAVYREGRPSFSGGDLTPGVRRQILVLIMRLRQLCALTPTKMDALVKCFEDHRPGTRTLIFCNWLREIDMVTEVLDALADGTTHRVMQFHGRMNATQRDEVVEAFQNPESTDSMTLIVQIQAGGTALNLQAASRVYIMSPAWTATAEMQAIARAHRTHTVHQVCVTRFVTQGTIEEFMHGRQDDKLETAANMLDDERLKEALLAHNGKSNWGSVALFGSEAFDD